MNKYVKFLAKGLITSSCIVAINEVIGYHANPYKSATWTRLMCNVSAASIGYVIGNKVSREILNRAEDMIIFLGGLEG